MYDMRFGRKIIFGLTPFVLLFLLLEAIFFLFPSSDGNGMTLAAKRWKQKYWHPINSLGYRDRPPDSSGATSKPLVLVTGDSFASGHGINRFDDSLTNQLQLRLGEPWTVRCAAVPGWGTLDELKAVVAYPSTPSVIVLVYVYNDIVPAAAEFNIGIPSYLSAPGKWVQVIIDHSYLANFLYWKVVRARSRAKIHEDIRHFEDVVYGNQQIMDRHLAQLELIVSHAKKSKAKLLVVCFPDLGRMGDSHARLQPILRFFKSRADGLIDVGGLVGESNGKEYIVNGSDLHPNESLVRMIADKINEKYF